MSPFFAILCELMGKCDLLILKRDVRALHKLRRNAKLMADGIRRNIWVSWKWLLNDLPVHPVTLYTDVSTSFGTRAWFDDLGIQFSWEQLKNVPELKSFWTNEEQINVLELFIIHVAAVYWKNSFSGHLVKHLGDNKAANSWVNKSRSGTIIAEEIVIELTMFQRQNNFKILSKHIKGKENLEADLLSREWTNEVQTRLGKVNAITIDPNHYIGNVIQLLRKTQPLIQCLSH